jgi:hypothetical protein
MKYRILALLPVFALAGCASLTPSEQTTLTAAESYAWSVANALETVNTASGQPLDETLATQALGLAGLTGPKTTAYTAIGTTIVNAVINAGKVAANAGASPAGVQAAQTTVLSDPGVIATAAASN